MHGTTLVSLIDNVEIPTRLTAQPQKRQLLPHCHGLSPVPTRC